MQRRLQALANIPVPGPPFHIVTGRVGTACQPSAPWGLTSFGILNVSDPVGALCLSRAPPAGRGAIYLALLIKKGAAKPRSYLSSVIRTLYSVISRPPAALTFPPLHRSSAPICTFALPLFDSPPTLPSTLSSIPSSISPFPLVSKLLLLDCDSTLSALEGIDELGRLRGPATFKAVEDMTNAAMNGGTPMEAIFAKRLDIIQPTKAELESIGALYISTVEPTAVATLTQLRTAGWTIIIVSGGFTQAIRPLADFLGITRVEAVVLKFKPDGSYAGFDETCPTCRTKGKNEIARRLRAEFKATTVVMVGDGASDLEVKGDADVMIGFGRYTQRPKVVAGADRFITSLDQLPLALS